MRYKKDDKHTEKQKKKKKKKKKKTMDSDERKPVFGFSIRSYQNQPGQLQRLSRTVKSRLQQVSYKRITKALIRLRILCGCTGWSAPLLCANPQRQASFLIFISFFLKNQTLRYK